LTKDGRIINTQSDWNYKKDKNGNIIGFISIITDITNRLRAEEEKIRLEKKLHHVQKMEAIGTLAGGIAHDFNNILGSIMLNTELAIDDLPEDNSSIYSLKQVLKGSHRAKDLVEQILTFSRESEIERKPIRINSIVKETLRMLRAMLPTTIVMQQDIAEDVSVILADSTQIQQLVINLSNNAAHAMIAEGGKLKVKVEDVYLDEPLSHSDMNPGRYVRLSVSDMGCGMKPEIKDRIFDPFFTTKRPGEGTGLGLSVVHGIVIHHDGFITVESEEGKGSTFEIYLPIIDDGTISFLKPSISVQTPTGNENILFVDDEEVVVDANRRILQRLGYNVTISTDSKKALAAFRKKPEKFDLVITDMTMPSMTGAELARELIKIRPDIPIILCTGYSQLITPEKSNAIGIQEFVMKPFSRNEIAEAIRKVLDKNRS
ncbi:MAG: response regulator, partial [Deltaproteobacteria bacterium]